eukprot:gnl/Trimastix_PCT/488.p1 GENE.gnl/Trimastix_PCT/488~~gnl/Trimastix_PCT/488.p1  ORF type:complete len:764 (+),score=264.58 gnl/Trimastix_PCT/488:1720-4011(+)
MIAVIQQNMVVMKDVRARHAELHTQETPAFDTLACPKPSRRAPEPPKVASHICGLHGKELEVYCSECREIVCSHCLLFGPHKSHTCVQFPEAVAAVTPGINADLQEQEHHLHSLNERREAICQRIRLVEQSKQAAKEKLDTQFRSLHEMLDRRKAELVAQIDKAATEKTQLLTDQQEHTEQTIQNGQKGMRAIRRAIEAGDPFEILFLDIQSRQNLEASIEALNSTIPPDDVWLALRLSPALLRLAERHGTLELIPPEGDATPARVAGSASFKEITWTGTHAYMEVPSAMSLQCVHTAMGHLAVLHDSFAKGLQTLSRAYETIPRASNAFANVWPQLAFATNRMSGHAAQISTSIREAAEQVKQRLAAAKKQKTTLQKSAQRHASDFSAQTTNLRKVVTKANKARADAIKTADSIRAKHKEHNQRELKRLNKVHDAALRSRTAFEDEKARYEQRVSGLTQAMASVAESFQGMEEDAIDYGRAAIAGMLDRLSEFLVGFLDEANTINSAASSIRKTEAIAAVIEQCRDLPLPPAFAYDPPEPVPTLDQLIGGEEEPAPSPHAPQPARASTPTPLAMMQAVANYDACEDGELSFKSGDIVAVWARSDSGWWECSLRGQRGLCPSTFLTPTSDSAAPQAAPEQAAPKQAAPESADDPIAESESAPPSSAASATVTIDVEASPKPGNPEAESAAVASPFQTAEDDETLDTPVNCRVDFEYTASDSDELSLATGETILLLSRSGGWYYGTNERGESGFFPPSYISILG